MTAGRVRRRRARPRRARPSRRAQPLRRGDLVHGRRQRHPPARAGRGERRPPGDGRDPRVPGVHERGRPRRCTPARGPASSSSAPARSGSSSTTRRASARADRRPPNPAFDPRRCLALAGSPNSDGINDVLQYWFGAYALAAGDGHDPDTGDHFGVDGIDDPFVGLSWTFGPDGADNQNMSASFVSTSGILPRTEFPQFNSWASSRYAKPGGPFSPHTGDQYVYSQIADVTYKRLTREIAVPAGGGDLTFWTLVGHRARLGPPVRGGPDRRRNRLDDAAGRERAHDHRAGRQLRGRVARPAPVARPLPDVQPRRGHVHGDRHHRSRGTPPPATPPAGSSGGSTSTRTPAGPSRSRSPTRATGRCRASACSSTT